MKQSWLLILTMFVISCVESPGKKEKKESKNEDVVVAKYSDGTIRAEIQMKDGKKNGKALEYYKSGKLYREIYYVDGKKEGIAKRFFENGKIAQETNYKNDKIHGIQRKFREDGKLASEATYFEDQPCSGVKEFLVDGRPKDNYPKIIITPVDKTLIDGTYTLQLSLSDKVKEVEYFTGKLSKENYIGMEASKVWTTDKYGKADITYNVAPGTFIMDKINVIAKIKTPLGNYYITQRSFNVAAENR